MWVTPSHIECLVFRIFSGETACVRRPGWQPSSSPGALCTHLLIRSRQPLLPKCLKKQSELQYQPESFSFAKDSRKTSNKSKNRRNTNATSNEHFHGVSASSCHYAGFCDK